MEMAERFSNSVLANTVPFKSIQPSPVPSLVAVAEIGHLSPVPGSLASAGRQSQYFTLHPIVLSDSIRLHQTPMELLGSDGV